MIGFVLEGVMKTVVRELVVARSVSIDTIPNDPVDVRCGGPYYLGFDFKVDADEDVSNLREYLTSVFADCHKPYERISITTTTVDVPKEHIWSREKMRQYITEYKE